MILHDAVRLALQIGTPLAAVRVLTWLVALFGSDRLSKRATLLLRRRSPDHEHSAQDAEQTGVRPVFNFTPSTRKTLVAEISYGDFDHFGPPGRETKDDPKAFRSDGPRATKATDLILEPTPAAKETIIERQPVHQRVEAALRPR